MQEEGGTEFFEAVKNTADATRTSEHMAVAHKLYECGHRLTEAQLEALEKLRQQFQSEYDKSCGWDDSAREKKNNLGTGIDIARGLYVEKAVPVAMEA